MLITTPENIAKQNEVQLVKIREMLTALEQGATRVIIGPSP